MAKIFEIATIRARQIRLARLKEILGELFNRVAIPPGEMVEQEELDYIFPVSLLRTIDDLTVGELDDLANGKMKFLIIK